MDQRVILSRRYVSEALRLDSEHHWKAAYQQYLSCLIYMFQMLLDDSQQKASLRDVQTEGTARVLRMAQQCADRVSALISEESADAAAPPPATPANSSTSAAEGAACQPSTQHSGNASVQDPTHAASAGVSSAVPPFAPQHERTSSNASHPGVVNAQISQENVSNSLSQSVPPQGSSQSGPPAALYRYASAGAAISPPTSAGAGTAAGAGAAPPSKLSPVDVARLRNQQLMTAYQRRLEKLDASGISASSKLRMNMSMLRQVQENIAIGNRRQASLVQKMNERQRRLTEEHQRRLAEAQDPLDHRQLAVDVQEFERNLDWVKEHRRKIADNPDDGNCISSFANRVLSTKDHPIGRKLGLCQYQIYHALLPLAKHNRPPSAPGLLQSSPQVAHSAAMTSSAGAGVGTSGSGTAPDGGHRHQVSGAADGQARPSFTRTPTEDDDGTALAAVLDILGMGVLPKSSTDAPAHLADTFVVIGDGGGGDGGGDGGGGGDGESPGSTGAEDPIGGATATTPPVATPQSILAFGESLCTEQELEQADNCACVLKEINKDVHNAIDQLEVALLVSYEEIRTSTGRDQCRVAIETNLFPALWPLLLDVFRMANIAKEKACSASLTVCYHHTLGEVGVAAKYRMDSSDQQQTSPPPYAAAIGDLRRLITLTVPLEKLDCVVATSRSIIQALEDYFMGIGKSRQEASLGCDDLLPILSYCIVQTGAAQLISECAAMEEFIHEGYLMGEEGYCLTTLQTAVSHVASMGMPRHVAS